MTTAILFASLLSLEAANSPLNDPFGHLPGEAVCARMFFDAQRDLGELIVAINITNDWAFIRRREEYEFLVNVWNAARWASSRSSDMQTRRTYASCLERLIGRENFNSGRLPLPFSVRSYAP